jgi:hypothetical protein
MVDYVQHMGHYMFAVGCRSNKVDHLTNFIGIITTIGSSTTLRHHSGDFATSRRLSTPYINFVMTHYRLS